MLDKEEEGSIKEFGESFKENEDEVDDGGNIDEVKAVSLSVF